MTYQFLTTEYTLILIICREIRHGVCNVSSVETKPDGHKFKDFREMRTVVMR
jgi:hypothetical protein